MKNIIKILVGTGLILSIPLVAMQFNDSVDWSISDFVIVGVMLFIAGMLIDLTMRKAGKYRMISIITIVALSLWLWAELAVGIFTNWGS